MKKIAKLLVANRGEIALRVLRSAKEMGIATVAIYSEADRLSPHVRYADEAVCVGPPASAQSYLRGDKIIEICHELGVDAIHPGYGFLSENAGFARAVREAGLIFVGPSPEAMNMMGDKLSAKQAVKAYNIPLVPGTDEAISDVEAAKQIAQEVGFPILIKASAGGGGKGMRLVHAASEFEEQMQLAINEAVSAFGDGAVFIEKFVTGPRHIEIQVLGDEHGNIVHLFERECSIQRRHQKVIEEAPSSVLTPELRAEMGRCAVDVARACQYAGAGTVEFLLDDQHRFYFLEMNTRLQVEHPVTEQITGLDLVKEQIRVAEGQPGRPQHHRPRPGAARVRRRSAKQLPARYRPASHLRAPPGSRRARRRRLRARHGHSDLLRPHDCQAGNIWGQPRGSHCPHAARHCRVSDYGHRNHAAFRHFRAQAPGLRERQLRYEFCARPL
jgi:acetyl-CoA carboxylase biotin carboxylase subunit